MIKKQIAVALGAALAFGGTSLAQAGYFEYANEFSASYAFSDFSNGDNVTKLTFSNISGNLEFNIPPAGLWSVSRKGDFFVDYNGTGTPSPSVTAGAVCSALGMSGWDYCNRTTTYTPTATVDASYVDISGTQFIYDWDNDVFTSDGVSYPSGEFTASANGLVVFLGAFLGPVLGTYLADNIGDGSVTVQQVFDGAANTWTLTLTETAGVGLESMLYALDSGTSGLPLPAPLQNDMIDGQVYANGSMHIPEPASVALLGLGLVGLAVRSRSKKA